MDTEKVIEFLREVTTQIGPAGEQAFRIVANRVIAESIAWLVFVGIITLIYAVIMIFGVVGSIKAASDEESA